MLSNNIKSLTLIWMRNLKVDINLELWSWVFLGASLEVNVANDNNEIFWQKQDRQRSPGPRTVSIPRFLVQPQWIKTLTNVRETICTGRGVEWPGGEANEQVLQSFIPSMVLKNEHSVCICHGYLKPLLIQNRSWYGEMERFLEPEFCKIIFFGEKKCDLQLVVCPLQRLQWWNNTMHAKAFPGPEDTSQNSSVDIVNI